MFFCTVFRTGVSLPQVEWSIVRGEYYIKVLILLYNNEQNLYYGLFWHDSIIEVRVISLISLTRKFSFLIAASPCRRGNPVFLSDRTKRGCRGKNERRKNEGFFWYKFLYRKGYFDPYDFQRRSNS